MYQGFHHNQSQMAELNAKHRHEELQRKAAADPRNSLPSGPRRPSLFRRLVRKLRRTGD